MKFMDLRNTQKTLVVTDSVTQFYAEIEVHRLCISLYRNKLVLTGDSPLGSFDVFSSYICGLRDLLFLINIGCEFCMVGKTYKASRLRDISWNESRFSASVEFTIEFSAFSVDGLDSSHLSLPDSNDF